MIRNMHKHLSIIALACMVSLSATAKQRTQQQLLQAAQAFVQANGGPAKGAKSKVTFTQLLSNDQITLLNSSNGQALIMANDDAFQPIVGYTDAPVDRNNMAPAFEWWMTTISQAMEETLAKGATPTQVKKNAAYREAVDKLMTTEWGQSEPYYNLTPTYTQNYQETHYVTGCVATAMAQVMKYHDYPERVRVITAGPSTPTATTAPAPPFALISQTPTTGRTCSTSTPVANITTRRPKQWPY